MKSKIRLTVFVALIATFVLVLGACFPGASIEGTWSGSVVNSLCEMEINQGTIELTFTDDTVAVTGGTVVSGGVITSGASGSYELQENGRFTLAIDDGGLLEGVLIANVEAGHALLILDSNPPNEDQNGYVGVLQIGNLDTQTVSDTDFVGNWSGSGVRVDPNYSVVENVSSEMTVGLDEVLVMNGTWGSTEMSLTGSVTANDASLGYYSTSSNGVTFASEEQYTGFFLFSYDKQWVATALLTDSCGIGLFDQLQDQKFALYERQP